MGGDLEPSTSTYNSISPRASRCIVIQEVDAKTHDARGFGAPSLLNVATYLGPLCQKKKEFGYFWLVVEEVELDYHNSESILLTIYPQYGNLDFV